MWRRDATVGFCPDGGGTWPAVQTLIVFLITNIIAHAATIQIAAGSDTKSRVKRVMNAILLPVSAGDSAFHSLGRWFSRWIQNPKMAAVLRGDTLEDAAISGAIAISVPIEFAPLVIGRWELVDETRTIVKFEDRKSWRSPKINNDSLKFRKPSAKFERYLPFILPPDFRFEGDYLSKKHTIMPSSSALSSVVGIVQVGLSIRQLSLQYGSSIADKGLSSPYLAVIPYMLMSLVNLVANTLVGQYRGVTMLPMKKFSQKPNEVFIIKCLNKDCLGKRECKTLHRRRIVSIKSSDPAEHGATGSGDPKAAEEPQAYEIKKASKGPNTTKPPTPSPTEWSPDEG
jgi:hypothetical protein